jgi:hypothetical protein
MKMSAAAKMMPPIRDSAVETDIIGKKLRLITPDLRRQRT